MAASLHIVHKPECSTTLLQARQQKAWVKRLSKGVSDSAAQFFCEESQDGGLWNRKGKLPLNKANLSDLCLFWKECKRVLMSARYWRAPLLWQRPRSARQNLSVFWVWRLWRFTKLGLLRWLDMYWRCKDASASHLQQVELKVLVLHIGSYRTYCQRARVEASMWILHGK